MSETRATVPPNPSPALAARGGLWRDGAWTLANKISAQALQLGVFVSAARFLQPAEFGLFAFCSAVAILLVVVAECGWREYVMSQPNAAARLDEIATLALAASVGLTIAGLGGAAILHTYPPLAPEALLVGFFCLWIIPAVLSALYEGILVSRDRVRVMARVRILAEALGAGAAIAGLWAGLGILALIAGRVLTAVVFVVCAALVTRYVPRLRYNAGFTRGVLLYSRYILVNRLAVQVRSYSGTLIVGISLGLGDAGLFRAAERLVAALSELVAEPARMLAWIVFRRHAGAGPAEWQACVTHFAVVMLVLVAPVFVGMALLSQDIVALLLGSKWAPAAAIVPFMALRQFLVFPGVLTEPMLSVAGAIRRTLPVVLANASASVLALLALAPLGLVAAAVAQVIAGAFALGTTVLLQGRHGGVAWRRVLRGLALVPLALATLAGAVLAISGLDLVRSLGLVVSIAAQALGGAAVYGATVGVLWLLWRRVWGNRRDPSSVKSRAARAFRS